MLEGSHPTTRKLSVDLTKLRLELRKVRSISDNDVAILHSWIGRYFCDLQKHFEFGMLIWQGQFHVVFWTYKSRVNIVNIGFF